MSMYTYAALAVIVRTLREKAEGIRADLNRRSNYYRANNQQIPDYVKRAMREEYEIADLIDEYITNNLSPKI